MNMTKGIDLNATVLATLANDCNCTVTATVKLDEDGLPGGIPGGNGDAPGTAIMATGNLGYSFGNNGPASSEAFTWKLDNAPSLTSAGEDVTFTLSNDGRTAIGTTDDGGTVLTLVLTDVARGSYKITLSEPLDHPISGTEDDLVFSFDYAITDSQGGEAQARMVVIVDDDTPEGSVTFPTSVQEGDSITGTWSVDGGADGVASTVVTLPGDTTHYALNTPIDTGLGTLIVRDDGTWSFNVDDNLDLSQDPKLIFDIVTTDGDGDTVNCYVCIPIVDGGDGVPTTPETDGDPATVAPTATVDEDGLPGGIAGLDKRRVGALALGIVPSIAAGVWLLSWLSESAETLLTLLLGALVLYGGLSGGMKPRPHAAGAAPWTFAAWGVFTGLLGGLFGMPGPPAIYHCYRQPLSLNTIRLMLILCFAITSTARTLYVGLQGGLTPEVWGLAVWAMPVVAVATWMGRRFPPPCSAPTMRRVAMLTLVFIGGGLLIDAAGSLI